MAAGSAAADKTEGAGSSGSDSMHSGTSGGASGAGSSDRSDSDESDSDSRQHPAAAATAGGAHDGPLGLDPFADFIAFEPDPEPAAAGLALGREAEPQGAGDIEGPAAQPGVVVVVDGSGDGQLPWERASTRIRSPLLRLHNGAWASCVGQCSS